MARPGGCKFYLKSTCAQPHRVWVLSSSQQAGSWTAEHTRLFPSSCQQAHVPRSPATDWVRGEGSVTADHALLRSCLAPSRQHGTSSLQPCTLCWARASEGQPHRCWALTNLSANDSVTFFWLCWGWFLIACPDENAPSTWNWQSLHRQTCMEIR